MAKVWSKRFDNALDPFIEKFNASIGFDRKLILEDLDCSIAHAKMLSKTKVISSSEAYQIINGLELIKVEYLEGKFCPGPPSEDIHYCIDIYVNAANSCTELFGLFTFSFCGYFSKGSKPCCYVPLPQSMYALFEG